MNQSLRTTSQAIAEDALGFYYRYYDDLKEVQHWGFNLDTYYPPRVEIKLEQIPIVRRTPGGVFLSYATFNDPYIRERFVANFWQKKYAWPTLFEARKDFLRRKRTQFIIHEERMQRARAALNTASMEWQMPVDVARHATLQEVYGKDIVKGEFEDDIPY
ncbi:hypothetical protein [Rhizobium phage RHph_X2_28B]|uniref:hypothetical protein n=1 Tax=Rhizobium phage RHph_X2_28B TaxID=2836086 RepID=UPI0023295DF1|nr:hypothetical protein PP751_gp043 [Rhizobium phage RHph_X2_28B]QWY83495.1 hypothetical protein [Rhizobium phage RHph_X2_28B]QWY83731.1 hypothetical protein [Rhizobium phage RHph_X3_15]